MTTTYRVSIGWPATLAAASSALFLVSLSGLMKASVSAPRMFVGLLLVLGIMLPLTVFAIAAIFGAATVGDGVVTLRAAFKTRRFRRGDTKATVRVLPQRGIGPDLEVLTLTRISDGKQGVFFVSFVSRHRRGDLLTSVSTQLDVSIGGLEQLPDR